MSPLVIGLQHRQTEKQFYLWLSDSSYRNAAVAATVYLSTPPLAPQDFSRKADLQLATVFYKTWHAIGAMQASYASREPAVQLA